MPPGRWVWAGPVAGGMRIESRSNQYWWDFTSRNRSSYRQLSRSVTDSGMALGLCQSGPTCGYDPIVRQQ